MRRRPTLVQNVETLANIALIARHGPDWFRAAGPATAPGTALMTVSGAVARPGVYEVALGTTIGALLDRAGGYTEPPQAVLAGGYFGGWLPLPAAAGVPLTDQALRAAGAAFGPGVLVVLPASACPLAETARVTSYLAGQSAGQCGPCLNGLPALAEALGLSRSAGPARRAGLDPATARPGQRPRRLPPARRGRRPGRQHPDGFADDVRQHAEHGPCGRAAGHPWWRCPAAAGGGGAAGAAASGAGDPPAGAGMSRNGADRGDGRRAPGAGQREPVGRGAAQAGTGDRRRGEPRTS